MPERKGADIPAVARAAAVFALAVCAVAAGTEIVDVFGDDITAVAHQAIWSHSSQDDAVTVIAHISI